MKLTSKVKRPQEKMGAKVRSDLGLTWLHVRMSWPVESGLPPPKHQIPARCLLIVSHSKLFSKAENFPPAFINMI